MSFSLQTRLLCHLGSLLAANAAVDQAVLAELKKIELQVADFFNIAAMAGVGESFESEELSKLLEETPPDAQVHVLDMIAVSWSETTVEQLILAGSAAYIGTALIVNVENTWCWWRSPDYYLFDSRFLRLPPQVTLALR